MATTIQYWGTANYQELPVTGRLVVWTRGQKQSVPDAVATLLISAGVGFERDSDPDNAAPIPLSSDYTLTTDDEGRLFYCTTALVVTVPVAVSVIIDPPATGNVTIRSSGGMLLNGATADLTRARSANPIGVAIKPYAGVAGSVGVSGS